jgi:DNA-binding NtrC family response regulator
MNKNTVILIAERNPRIRNLIKRDLMIEGYNVFTVENVLQLKNWFCMRRRPDILVIDPELPGSEAYDMWGILAENPELPVIIHCLRVDEWVEQAGQRPFEVVEKNSNSISFLIQRIKQIVDTPFLRKEIV